MTKLAYYDCQRRFSARARMGIGQLSAGNSKQYKTFHLADIINYQIDVDFAQKFAPEITKLLADADRDVVRNAAELSHDLSKSEAACFVMTKGLCSYMSTNLANWIWIVLKLAFM